MCIRDSISGHFWPVVSFKNWNSVDLCSESLETEVSDKNSNLHTQISTLSFPPLFLPFPDPPSLLFSSQSTPDLWCSCCPSPLEPVWCGLGGWCAEWGISYFEIVLEVFSADWAVLAVRLWFEEFFLYFFVGFVVVADGTFLRFSPRQGIAWKVILFSRKIIPSRKHAQKLEYKACCPYWNSGGKIWSEECCLRPSVLVGVKFELGVGHLQQYIIGFL